MMFSASEEPVISNSIRTVLADLILDRTGLLYTEDRQERLVEKLTPLVLEHGFDSFLDYYYLLKYGEESETEWRKVEAALAVNETYFWREADQIRAIAELFVPKIQNEHPGREIQIWHAACSSGEEAYSMAIALQEAGCYNTGPIRILGTDFDEDALTMARKGVFRERAFRAMPLFLRQKYFSQNGADEKLQIDDDIRNRVDFSYLNLMDMEKMAVMKDIDVIFCRNAFIYFSPKAIQQTVDAFFRSLAPHGRLCLASSESLFKISTLFEIEELGGALIYRK